MSNSSKTERNEIHIISKFGPIRIELLDQHLNRIALGFGELREQVPAGLYMLQCSAGATRTEEIIKVESGQKLEKEVELSFPSVAPLSVGSASHEFHEGPASGLSHQPPKDYGSGGGLMIFVRTIDGDGRAPVPIERLSLWDASMREVGHLAADAEREDLFGWACLSAKVDPGGYALRWQTVETKGRGTPQWVDQSLWVAEGWMTMVFIAYVSERGQLERQSASIHMSRMGDGFNPGPSIHDIRSKPYTDWELKEAKVNQALDLALSGLRTGNLIVPGDLLELLLNAKFKNPMLGIIGAHTLLQQRTKNWELFDIVLRNLDILIPGHPDVTALHLLGKLMREQPSRTKVKPLSWPPMVYAGYRGLIARNWLERKIVRKDSVAERSAARLLPESPWSCWLSSDLVMTFIDDVMSLNNYTQKTFKAVRGAVDPNTQMADALRRLASSIESRGAVKLYDLLNDLYDPAVRRVGQYLASLLDMGESFDPTTLSLETFRQTGLPVAVVEQAIYTLANAASRTIEAKLLAKYDPVISAAQNVGCNVSVSVEDGRLNISGNCPTQYAVNQAWDALKEIDPSMNAGDFAINLTADRQDIYGEYEVQSGDTLSGIANRVTAGKLSYQQIFEANRDALSDPDKIHPGQKLKIPKFS